jgi:integrase
MRWEPTRSILCETKHRNRAGRSGGGSAQRGYRVLVFVLAYCGLRWGEAVALRVRDVEFLRRRIVVRDNAVQLGIDYAEGLTKSRKDRSVPVPQFVHDELSVQCRGRGLDDLIFGDGEHYLPRPKSDGGWFAAAVKRAGVQAITPHDLRHTCASLAILGWRQRARATADARPRRPVGDAAGVRRSVRHRP